MRAFSSYSKLNRILIYLKGYLLQVNVKFEGLKYLINSKFYQEVLLW